MSNELAVCQYCGKEFSPSPYQRRQLKAEKPIFCSISCGSIYAKGKSKITPELINKLKALIDNLDYSYTDICNELNISMMILKRLLDQYNLNRTPQQMNEMTYRKTVQGVLNKYGVTNVMKDEQILAKQQANSKKAIQENKEVIVNKIKATKLDRYGDENYHNIDKAQQTMLQKYGVQNAVELNRVIEKRKQGSVEKFDTENPLSSKLVHDKSKEAIKQKYGETSVLKVTEIREKINKTIQNKYGVYNIMKLPKYQSKHRQTMLERYSVTSGFLTDNGVASHKCGTISKLNKEFAEFLKNNLNVDITFEKSIVNFIYDLCIDNLLIDINPTVSHNSTISYPYKLGVVKENKPLKNDYHYKRYLNAIEHGYELISIFDWMSEEKVLDIIKAKLKMLDNRIYGNKCIVKEITQLKANEFLDKYHIQGGANSQTVCIGLFYKDELVQVQTFGKPRFNKNVEWEAIRLANKFNTYIIGGVSKGFKYFVNKYNPQSIISYNSLNISSGQTDNLQGFKFMGYNKSQGIWVNTKNNNNPKYVRDTTLRNLGIDKVLNKPSVDFPDYEGTYETSNEYLIIQEGYVKVYDCGNVTYVWNQNAM